MEFQNVAASGGMDVAHVSIAICIKHFLFICAAPLTRDAPRNTHKIYMYALTLTHSLCPSLSSAQQNTHTLEQVAPLLVFSHLLG